MSYILDALKKSEGEREAGKQVPDWQTSHSGAYTQQTSPTKQQLLTISVLLAILVTLLIGGGIWLYNNDKATTTDKTVVAKAMSEQAPSASTQAPLESKNSIENTDRLSSAKNPKSTKTTFEKFSAVQDTAVDSKSSRTTSTSGKKTGRDGGSVVFSDKPLSAKTVKKTKKPSRKVVKVTELPTNILRSMPSISFAGHVYSENPAERSVMINGKKMKEGQAVTSNLTLDKITAAGANFSYKGWRFSLSALEDWQFNGKR